MEPIRIVHIFASLDRGGAETMIMNIYRVIDKNLIQFDFVVNNNFTNYAFELEINELGGNVFRVSKLNLFNFFTIRNNWRTLFSEHPEWQIIHIHNTSTAIIYMDIAKSLNKVTIVHSHTSGRENSLKSLIKVLIRYPLRNKADYLVACSKSSAEWMFGNRSEFAYIMNNSIDLDEFAPNEKKRNITRELLGIQKKFVIGHVGSFTNPKNHDYLIDVFKNIYIYNKKAILLLVGDGKLLERIKKKVIKLNLIDNVVFLGNRTDISELLNAMDVFVFPSLYEGFPVTLIEAQATGIKCFVSDTITSEIKISNTLEFFTLTNSPNALARNILDHVESYKREDTRNDIEEREYSLKGNVEKIQKYYLKILEEKWQKK